MEEDEGETGANKSNDDCVITFASSGCCAFSVDVLTFFDSELSILRFLGDMIAVYQSILFGVLSWYGYSISIYIQFFCVFAFYEVINDVVAD